MNKKSILCRSLMALGMVAVMASCGSKSESTPAAGDNSVEVSSSAESSSSEISAGSLDEALDQYEEFVDSYVKLLKKAAEGDEGAVSEYMEMLQKAEGVAEQLSKAEKEMTTEQLNRLMKIQTKLTQAAQEL